MRYNLLGKTGLYVSELCLGAMTFGGAGGVQAIGQLGQKEALALISAAFDAGVNFIDTADVYADGESAAGGRGAQDAQSTARQLVVATKVRVRVRPASTKLGCLARTFWPASTPAASAVSTTSICIKSTASIR
jgi:aryl-alcohol dehydrogenase-like predicted oxidoreductase